jgi:hypothetical protein
MRIALKERENRRISFTQENAKITARRSRNQRRRKTTANRHECSAFIRVHSWLEESSRIRAILNIGTAEITAGHSPNKRGPGKEPRIDANERESGHFFGVNLRPFVVRKSSRKNKFLIGRSTKARSAFGEGGTMKTER